MKENMPQKIARGAKLGLLAGGLLAGSAVKDNAEAQTVNAQKTEIVKESQGEYIIPARVLVEFKKIVDSTDVVQEGAKGAYLSNNFLFGNRETRLVFALMQAGYSNQEIQKYVSILKGKNIIFSETQLNSPEFEEVRAHEWMHKLVSELSPKDKKTLDEARDFIIKDYSNKQVAAGDSILTDYKKATTREEKDTLIAKYRQIFEVSQPILLGSDPDEVFSILRNSEEFYAYLIGDKLNPSVENTIRVKFPKAIIIYDKLKEQVKNRTNTK